MLIAVMLICLAGGLAALLLAIVGVTFSSRGYCNDERIGRHQRAVPGEVAAVGQIVGAATLR